MRGGIFIPIDLMELLNHWGQKKPKALLILYNHYDSTVSLLANCMISTVL